MVHVMFHETASRKLCVFTLYVYPKMLNEVSYFHLLDELIATFGGLFLVFFFFIQIFSKQQRRTRSDATVVMWHLIWVCTVCQRPTKWRQCLNKLNITPRVLEITSRNFRKRKNLECKKIRVQRSGINTIKYHT